MKEVRTLIFKKADDKIWWASFFKTNNENNVNYATYGKTSDDVRESIRDEIKANTMRRIDNNIGI